MAGAGKKTFTAGEVLTASDVNTFLMEQSVMVFGGTAARSSAIPTPSEGMTTYRTDTQQIESYDGAEWRGMSGLQLVKKQTIGSGVSSVNVTSAFSATYEAYKIIVTGGVSSADVNLSLKLGASTTAYYEILRYWTYGGTTQTPAGTSNGSVWNFVGNSTSNAIAFDANLRNPNLAKWTFFDSIYLTQNSSGNNSGVHQVATAYTDFTIAPSSGTLTGGTIYVYGYGT